MMKYGFIFAGVVIFVNVLAILWALNRAKRSSSPESDWVPGFISELQKDE